MSNQIKKYVYVSYLVQAINVAVNFVYSLVIVHLLGASGYGEYSVFSNSLAFSLLLFGFNIPSVLVFFMANKKIGQEKLLGSALFITLLVTLLLWLILSVSGSLGFSIHVFPDGSNLPLWIFFFVAQFFLLQLNQIFTALLNAHKLFIPVSVSVLMLNLLLLLFWVLVSAGVIVLSGSVFNNIWWVSIILNSCVLIYLVYLTWKKSGLRLKLAGMSELKLAGGFAVIVYFCNCLQFLNYKMDIWFIHYFDGEADTGVYALALGLSQLIWILPNAVSTVLLNYYEVEKKNDSVLLAMDYGSLTMYAGLVAAILLSVVYYFALPAIYGKQFDDVARLCMILFIGAVPFSLAIIIANLNSGIGFVRINLYATIFTFVLGLILDIILIPRYGISGALIAKVVIYVSGVLFHIIVGHILYKLPWKDLFKFPELKHIRSKKLMSN